MSRKAGGGGLDTPAAARRTGLRVAAALAVAPLAGLGPAVTPASVRAQPAMRSGRMPRIGLLSFGSPPGGRNPDPVRGMQEGLVEQGFEEGRNLIIERRYADDHPERLAAMAAELVQLKVDLIWAGGPAPRDAARRASSVIPIVTVSGSDPVREGWAASLARPGGNVTGLTVTFPELSLKRLELLKSAFGWLQRAAVIFVPAEMPDARQTGVDLVSAGRRIGIDLLLLAVRGPADFDAAFDRARRERVQALMAIATNTVVSASGRLTERAIADRLLTVGEFPPLAHAGFLATYGADIDDLVRRSAGHVRKVLDGVAPAELPIEQPAKFQLIVNLRTAQAIGVTVPAALLQRADEVIR